MTKSRWLLAAIGAAAVAATIAGVLGALGQGVDPSKSLPPVATGDRGTPSAAEEAADRLQQEAALARGAIALSSDETGQLYILVPAGRDLGQLPPGSGQPPIIRQSRASLAEFNSLRREIDSALQAAGLGNSGGYLNAKSGKLVVETAEPNARDALSAILASHPDLIDFRPGLTATPD